MNRCVAAADAFLSVLPASALPKDGGGNSGPRTFAPPPSFPCKYAISLLILSIYIDIDIDTDINIDR